MFLILRPYVSRQWTLQKNLTVTVSADWYLSLALTEWHSFSANLTHFSTSLNWDCWPWVVCRQHTICIELLGGSCHIDPKHWMCCWSGSASDRKLHGLPHTVLLNKVHRKFTVCEWMEFWEGLLHWLQSVEVWVKAGGAEKVHSLVPRPSYHPVLIANPRLAISCLLFVMKNWMMGNPLWNKLQQEVLIIPYTQHFSIKYV